MSGRPKILTEDNYKKISFDINKEEYDILEFYSNSFGFKSKISPTIRKIIQLLDSASISVLDTLANEMEAKIEIYKKGTSSHDFFWRTRFIKELKEFNDIYVLLNKGIGYLPFETLYSEYNKDRKRYAQY